ncbi:asparagine synthase (glutamine-hydrolyzing) [Motiliproteus sp.]|uniref:asparagine synthase (glutamine-hydrolyzing) n=1 Tax=Motiliproteus sp. TaxID=1898955 RepID=UPI003BAC1DB1
MCGIIGTISSDVVTAVSELLESLHHRGPDGQGAQSFSIANKHVWIGHTRLAILDLSTHGHQPMQSKDGRWWLTFNGEIYNHLSLRSTLVEPFKGHSDTETLVELISAHGIYKALADLNGMFAFAAFDTLENKLYLARDPYGIKPLYYSESQECFAFSSEVRALKRISSDLGGAQPNVSISGLQQFLTLRYVPSPLTLWDGIKRLPPGHVMCVDVSSRKSNTRPYVQPQSTRFRGSFDEAVSVYQQKLFDAVSRQLLSDVPVGVLLSGGIDSALVAAMAKEAGSSPPCFTVGFGQGHEECEIDDAAHTAKVLDLPFSQVHITPEQMMSSLPAIAKSIEEPLGTTSIMPMWQLVQHARKEVTVVLTGQGTDEPWGGYKRYQVELVRRRFGLPLFWSGANFALSRWLGKPESLERGFRSLSKSNPVEQIIEAASLFTSEERHLLTGKAHDGGVSHQIENWMQWFGNSSLSSVENMMRLDTRMNLADDLLLYGDKTSMAFSLEARVPMLDTELVAFVESLPIEYRIKWRQSKIIHKAMAERYLPSEIVHRPKKGFQVPFRRWSCHEWRDWLEPLLVEGLDGLLCRDGVKAIWHQHIAGKPDRSRQVFALLMLALWRKEHIV